MYFVGYVKTTKEVVLFDLKNHIVVSNTWGDELCNTSFDKSFCCLGIFKLFAYCHSKSSTYEAGKILFDGVMGYSS